MSLRTLSPTSASVVPTSATHSRPIVSELRPSGELPVIDCSCSVKKRLLGVNGRRRYNVVLVRLRYALIVSFVLGSFASWCLPFVKPQHGKWLAIVAVATQLLPVLNSFMSMRYDMLVLLFKTYEFWYTSVINLVSCVLIAMRTGDKRAVFMSLLAMMFENVLLVDATSRSVTSVVLSSVFGAVVILGYALLEAFKISTSSQNYLLVAYGSWLIDAVDVVIHGVSTIFAVLLRNGYRKWTAVRRIDQDSTVVRCVMYRARMILAVVDDSNVIHPNSGVTHAESVRAVHLSDNSVSSTSALRLVPGGTLIHSDSFFIPAVPFVLGSKPTQAKCGLHWLFTYSHCVFHFIRSNLSLSHWDWSSVVYDCVFCHLYRMSEPPTLADSLRRLRLPLSHHPNWLSAPGHMLSCSMVTVLSRDSLKLDVNTMGVVD